MDMAPWILVINVISLFSSDFQLAPSRTRGLTDSACLVLVQEVQGPRTFAYCYRDGTPDPGRASPSKPLPPPCPDCRPPTGLRWG